MRRALLTVVVLLSAAACDTQTPCGPSTCAGCCTRDGQCQPLPSEAACGMGGFTCDICVGDQACLAGRCTFPFHAPELDAGVEEDAGVEDAGTGGGAGGGVGGGGGTGATTQVTLRFPGGGAGAVAVEGAGPQTMTCTSECSGSGAAGRLVRFTASTPQPTGVFVGYAGCTPSASAARGQCVLEGVPQDTIVTAVFRAPPGPPRAAVVHQTSSQRTLGGTPVVGTRDGVGGLVVLRGTSLTLGPQTLTGTVLARLDPQGALVSTSAIDLDASTVHAVALLPDGSAWLSATLTSSAKPQGAAVAAGAYALHVTPQDAVDVVVPLGTAPVPTALAVSASGDVALGGTVSGTWSPGVTVTRLGHSTMGDSDAMVLVLSATGAPLRAWRIGGRYRDDPARVAWDGTGRLLVGTAMRDSGTIGSVSYNGGQFAAEGMVLRFDGDMLDAAARFDAQYEVSVDDLAPLPTGDVALVGNYAGDPYFVSGPKTASIVGADFVALLSPTLGLRWARVSEGVFGSRLAAANGTLVVASYYESGGSWGPGFHLGSTFGFHSLVARFTLTGSVLTSQAVLGSGNRPALGVMGTKVVLSALFTGPLALGTGVQSDGTEADAYLATLDY